MTHYCGVVQGINSVSTVCLRLIKASQWFETTPLPDDEWQVRVKVENETMLDTLICAAKFTAEDAHHALTGE